MHVLVDSNFIIKDYFEPPVEFYFGEGGITLRQLLEEIGRRCASVSFLEILKEDELGESVDSLLFNEKNFFSLPEGLNTPLRDGDRLKLEIYIEPVDGG